MYFPTDYPQFLLKFSLKSMGSAPEPYNDSFNLLCLKFWSKSPTPNTSTINLDFVLKIFLVVRGLLFRTTRKYEFYPNFKKFLSTGILNFQNFFNAWGAAAPGPSKGAIFEPTPLTPPEKILWLHNWWQYNHMSAIKLALRKILELNS